eukprot:GSChrysophyteH1.ASY1.ANO1.2936.1 assembled CDS
MEATSSAITDEFLRECRQNFSSSPTAKMAQNAMASASDPARILDVIVDRDIVQNMDHSFSTKLDEWSVTSQKQSGRCWLFAVLNLFRPGAMKKMNIKEFEFSQAYIHFWDKFERANSFLESCIELAPESVDNRTLAWLLNDPICDGGQWGMAMNLIRKYGLLHAAGKPAEMRLHKASRLKDIWNMLCIHLGTPPETVEWQWTDKDKQFHRKGRMTPVEFAAEYIQEDYNDYVCLVNDPRNEYYQTYSVDRLQSVHNGPPVVYLNIPIEEMKSITQSVLLDGTPVWMGCDVGKQMHRQKGLWHAKLFDYESFYGCSYGMNKADRLIHGQTLMTHAMLYTGVDVDDDGKARKWRVENSWGEADCGVKGFFTMDDSWFSEHMFEIAAPSKYLTDRQKDGLKTEPVMLPAWDPMGSLAQEAL